MSINRIVTRMAVVTALNNFLQAPWPTIAGPNIFDSKIEPVEDMATDKVFPCCVVYTDYDKDHWNKGSRVHHPRLLTVTLELLIVQAAKNDMNGGIMSYTLDCPVTDSEIENSLDFMEAQIFRALTADTISANTFNYICGDYTNVISRRGASVEGGQRLAARQITLEMKTNRDPIMGTIPAPINEYLTRIETFSDFSERVPEIRSFMTEDAGISESDRIARTFGYTSKVLEAIGTPRVPVTQVLPPTIVYLNPTGGPLP